MAVAIQAIRRERAQEYQRQFEQEGDEINADAERLDAEPTAQSDECLTNILSLKWQLRKSQSLYSINTSMRQYPSSEVKRSVQSAIVDYADTNRLSGGDLRRLAGITNMCNIVPPDADNADPSVTQFQDAYAEGYGSNSTIEGSNG